MRVLGFQASAEASIQALASEVRQALDSYAAGVNAWLGSHSGPLPLEFQVLRYAPEPWKPSDSLIWGKLMALQLSGNYSDELLRARLMRKFPAETIRQMYPEYPATAPVTLAADLTGLELRQAPSIPAPTPRSLDRIQRVGRFRRAQRDGQAGPGQRSASSTGRSDPMVSGADRSTGTVHHRSHGTGRAVPHPWPQQQDLLGLHDHRQRRSGPVCRAAGPSRPNRYLTPDGSRAFDRRTETIKVNGAPDEELIVRTTRHGPVLSDIEPRAVQAAPEGHVISLAFTGLSDRDTTAEALWRLNRAPDWEGFKAALQLIQAPQQNIVYADVQGNIGFYTPGLVPVRRKGDGSVPVPGWTDEYAWTGAIPFEELPHAFNPPGGRIVNANNRVVGPDYPWFLTNSWDDWHRAARIEQVLDENGHHDVDAAESLLKDNVSLAAQELLPLMLKIKATATPTAKAALDMLSRWDGTMTRDRTEPLIYEWWVRELNRALYADELGGLFPEVLTRQSPARPPHPDQGAAMVRRHHDTRPKRNLR